MTWSRRSRGPTSCPDAAPSPSVATAPAQRSPPWSWIRAALPRSTPWSSSPGLYDLPGAVADGGIAAQVVRRAFGSDEATWAANSPSQYVRAGLPPTWIVHGTADTDASPARAAGVRHTARSGGHGGSLDPHLGGWPHRLASSPGAPTDARRRADRLAAEGRAVSPRPHPAPSLLSRETDAGTR